jgi:hypothetical protein
MITRYVIRIFSTYEFQTECGLLHLDRIEGILGGFHFNVRILKLSGLLHLSRIYRGNSREHPSNNTTRKTGDGGGFNSDEGTYNVVL